MALRLAASPMAMSRSTASFRVASALRVSSPMNARVYFHASRSVAADSPSNVTDVYKTAPYNVLPIDQVHGSYHWDFERVLCVSMIPLLAASALNGAHPITDGLLGVVIPIHAHMGFDAMITDYLNPRKAPTLGKVVTWTLRGATVLVLVGCYQFNTSDIGLTELVKKSWEA
ncbi:membrane anchor subunit of succinate dehydrogenase, Sdh4 [Entomortierella beljakovae]|nr:membrane anchor subunit of succinate dehydrogenase, Sdh4 [Entomortierella beljakovae]